MSQNVVLHGPDGRGIPVRPAARLPLSARLRLVRDRTLGVGNFLDRAHRVSRASHEPFLFAQRLGEGARGVEAMSLDRLVEDRTTRASWYFDAGVRKGDPVGVHMGDGVDSFLQFLALTSLGAIPTLVNGRMDPAVAREYLNRVGVVGMVTDGPRPAELEAPADLFFRVTDHEVARGGSALPGVYPYPHGDDDPVMICHTSGTTGPPKAATFAHRQFFLGKRGRLVRFPAAARNRMLSALPQSHSAGISYLMTATLLGLPVLVMADNSGDAVANAMQEFRPTIVVAFPQTYAELARRDLTDEHAGTVHTWINTGDAAHEAHIRALVRLGRRGRKPGSRFVDGLGSSEMGMALFRKVSTPESTDYARCVGTPIGVVDDVAVLDDDGRSLGPDHPGRLGVRTPTLTPGYWNDSERTTKSSLSGYWLTGDVVQRDTRGRFFHLDRVPDVIHTAAGQVYSLPMEEAVLAGCPQAADCAVIAVRDPAGDAAVPFASVVLAPGATEPDDLVATLNTALTARSLPGVHGAVVARDAADFPVGATGKVLKRQLRERYADVLVQADRTLAVGRNATEHHEGAPA